MIKKSKDCTIRLATLSTLSSYHKPDEVLGYCKRCPKYGQIWSCPPHIFDIEQYLNQFQRAYIIGSKIRLNPLQKRDEALLSFQNRRETLNGKLLEIEAKIPNATVLFSGDCRFCKTCNRKDGSLCIDESKMRYSLESLGYKVSEVCENLLDEKLQWGKSSMPAYLFSVSAILTNDVIAPAKLKLFISEIQSTLELSEQMNYII